MEKVLLAGATGYLGSYILKELQESDYAVKVIVRSPEKLPVDIKNIEVIEAELTKPATIKNCCHDVDYVISTVGITRQKDDFLYMDVDYQANKNLLLEARRSQVKKFSYISVFKGQELKNLKMCAAKERFVEELKNSGLDYCIIRPTGFFSDMADFFKMASKGRIYLFGDGKFKSNPIHGQDLAPLCVLSLQQKEQEIIIGGPDILTQNEIARLAYNALNKEIKITHLPDFLRKFSLFLVRTFTSEKFYGPVEFFLTVLAMDMVAPKRGEKHLKDFYDELAQK
ncbi:SDR family oxidoreductase [Halanaerobium salsuginis]|jgi:uncharacterized protein YbjT (DUF2867 family)|uniref:Uncharacterized conserved protein YbjT, contains NAD(P)-binding and DUF2867 domains n=1 Tax=Halanaerobium salsuginis TaxID=29563 RepID=A0A1I4J3W6_9FIRM|nr:SDR family oxidoreductase [Halanaerobium salsuginis]SFL61285.1 Uncharacterized conserved protein YbjT, contains NAD(P)-binding and DUF2867 domains [Halanaerobium salsuginis]